MNKPSTIVCCGTGPSINAQQVEVARSKGFTLFACNAAFVLAPDCALLYAVNVEWWRQYWPAVKDLPCEKWSTSAAVKTEYPAVNWIDEADGYGLSRSPAVVHHGHGSGFTLVSLAHRAGAQRVILLGYELRYAPDYDGRQKRVGSSPRHFFGEYPESMRHWPSVSVIEGVHVGLVEKYRQVHEQGLVELVNATPGSALEPLLGFTEIDRC